MLIDLSMGGLISTIVLILVSVLPFVILPAIALSNHEQRQIEGVTGQNARSNFSDPFKIVNNSLPYNKYAFLTTQRSYASSDYHYTIKGRYLIGAASKDSVTQQLNSGVRALMLNTYSMIDDVGLCRNCHPIDYNKYYDSYKHVVSPAHDLFKEVEEFLTSNPSEIVTIFLQDEVETPNGLAKTFDATGLTKYMLPLTKMARYGGDWPLVKDMVAANQRLVVFSSAKTKEESEGIGYQGNFVIEYQYGSPEMDTWNCKYLAPLKKKSSKSLVLLNYPWRRGDNAYGELMKAIRQFHTCASGNWPNFIAVDYAEGMDVGPAFQAVNFVNGKLLCGCDDVNSCKGGSRCQTIKAKVIKTGHVLCIAFFIICILLGYGSRFVKYIKKKKYKLKR